MTGSGTIAIEAALKAKNVAQAFGENLLLIILIGLIKNFILN